MVRVVTVCAPAEEHSYVFYEYTGEKGDPGFEGPGVVKGHQGAPGETGFRGPSGKCNNDAP